MGLDLVELVMDVEDSFGITIADSDAEKIQTVGQLYQYVRQRLGQRSITPCPTATAFHRVRLALGDAGVARREDVRLHLDLTGWPDASPQAWEFFLRSLQLRPVRPPLPPEQATWLKKAIAASGIAGGLIFLFTILQKPPPLVPGLLWVGSLVVLILATKRLHPRLPAECATVGGFVRHFEVALVPQRDEVIWKKIVAIVAQIAGVEPDTIRAETNFITDLSLG
jgi:acyl carrier protein